MFVFILPLFLHPFYMASKYTCECRTKNNMSSKALTLFFSFQPPHKTVSSFIELTLLEMGEQNKFVNEEF